MEANREKGQKIENNRKNDEIKNIKKLGKMTE